ncbi:hypothetical protein BGZ83_000716 [Gryganskiella cystojenkinii]|nr:hypothetical protein BGZ83_000716 [Gryganskiella cystojenkinii]
MPAPTLETSIDGQDSNMLPRLQKVTSDRSGDGSVSGTGFVNDNSPVATSPANDLVRDDGDSQVGDLKDDTANKTTTTTCPENNKPTATTVKRPMVLTGLPPPALPPRPVFPSDLEHYQIHGHASVSFGGTAQYSQQMQVYLSDLRTDYKKQLKTYEKLQQLAIEDTSYATAVVDELDAMDEDPFTLDSFENLMRLHASKDKDFIIARVTTQDPNEENKLYHSYYSAHQINKVLFRTQPDEGLLHRMKARNPLNNMLVVGDVHYYSIKAKDINAVKPLRNVQSSSSSITSHSSRMSRCSRLAAQAIVASQSAASARSSPILGSDSSLFSRSNGIESPVSIIPPLMALSMQLTDKEGRAEGGEAAVSFIEQANPTTPSFSVANRPSTPAVKRRSSDSSSLSAGSQSPSTPNGFQPCRPSRLRQSVEPETVEDQHHAASGQYSPSGPSSTPPSTHQHHQHQAQSPLFQTLMGGRMRSRSNTISSVNSDKSISTVTSHGSCSSSCSAMSCISGCSVCQRASTATAAAAVVAAAMTSPDSTSPNSTASPSEKNDGSSDQDTPSSPSLSISSATSSSSSSSSNSSSESDEPATYHFKYLASDDDFLLRSSVRQIFKDNALETWDAVLFTISQNALREYAAAVPGEEPIQQLLSLHLQEQYQHEMEQQQQQQQHQQELLQLQIRQQQQLLEEQQALLREQQVQHQRAQEEVTATTQRRRQQQEQQQQQQQQQEPGGSTSQGESGEGQLRRQRSMAKMGSLLKIFGRGGEKR